MRNQRRFMWAVLAAAVALGCQHFGSNQPRLIWVKDDGTPAERAELIAARDACIETVDVSGTVIDRRWGHVEYAGQIIDCIKSNGYHLIDEPED